MDHLTSCGCFKEIGSSRCHIPHYCDHGNLFLYTKPLKKSGRPSSSPQKQGGLKLDEQEEPKKWGNRGGSVTRTCQHCGDEFKAPPDAVRRGKAKFCSRACCYATPRDAEMYERIAEKNRGQRRSKDSSVYKHGRYVGKKRSANWGLKRKGEELCRNCGRPAVHLHHIVPRSKSQRSKEDWKRNGMPLCNACHRGWHERRAAIPHHAMRDEEFKYATQVAGTGWVEHNYPDPPEVQLLTLDRVRRGHFLETDAAHEPIGARMLRLHGTDWLSEESLRPARAAK